MSQTSTDIPKLDTFDSSLALLREGYRFISSRCEATRSDAFRTRIMMRNVVCMRGPAAAQQFYHEGRFTRRGAMPSTVVPLLQDWGSVQTLDGEAHRHRKQIFACAMEPDSIASAVAIFREEWDLAVSSWEGRDVVLHDELALVMTRTALRWSGIPLDRSDPPRRAEELAAMIEYAGSFGPKYLRARLLRQRCERWAKALVEDIRSGSLDAPEGSAARSAALHRDERGELLATDTAAVELINFLRPIVAIKRFMVFAAHALHVHAAKLPRFDAESSDADIRSFVQEVRRFYPFFPMIGGRVLDPFTWRGHRFAKGEWVLLDLFGTNHHPGAWPEPDSFRWDRFKDWEGDAFSFVAQGGGGFMSSHRCPGEWLTIALTMEAVRRLAATRYDVPDQDLEVPLDRMPSLPKSGFRIVVQ